MSINSINSKFLIAGFGGQGILYVGKLLANIGLISEKEVTWMPSYGPAMRGGTCNCSVCISDKLIGSPVVTVPDVLVAMNSPSFDKFIGTVKKGGFAFVDSTLVEVGDPDSYDGVVCHAIPATDLAKTHDLKGMANIILLGKLIKETSLADMNIIKKAVEKSTKKPALVEINLKSIELGMSQ
ncbi:MAG: 2-oxoacid:acceptor oxidoreductase family protein [Oscillospiraceae bacterium]|nr:2-oxoacid:acceptor oxidoreductase family protein [Oscillospiraceae bacterium]